ncbi:MAG: HAMP domain-containing histidine kinase [Bacteroidetes bacterium]|nr:HAMP domain-containing histidine kinase [Bacteroidota bacterium]
MTPSEKKWIRYLLHDLRNPLSAIKTSLQIRKIKRKKGDESGLDLLDETMSESVKRLTLLMDMIQFTVQVDGEEGIRAEVSVPEMLNHFPGYLSRHEPDLLKTCQIEPSGSKMPLLIIPDLVDQVLVGLILFASHVKTEGSKVFVFGKLNQILIVWQDASPGNYNSDLFSIEGQVDQKEARQGTGFGIPLIFAHHAINEVLKGSISFQSDVTAGTVTLVISLPVA